MKRVFIFLAGLFIVFYVLATLDESDEITPEEQRLYYEFDKVGSSATKKTSKGVYEFALTEVNGREIDGNATFVANTPINRFELKVDGETFYYTPTGRVGNDPLCGITATDKHGRQTAICVEIFSKTNVKIRVWNSYQNYLHQYHLLYTHIYVVLHAQIF